MDEITELIKAEIKKEQSKVKPKSKKLFKPELFWCNELDPNYKDCECLMHYIGFNQTPYFPAKSLPPLSYQMELVNYYLKKPEGCIMVLLKARQIGASTIILDLITYSMYKKHLGKTNIIFVGNRLGVGKELLSRLTKKIPLKDIESSSSIELVLKNGSRTILTSSDPKSLAGLTKIGVILLDELSKTGIINDKAILDEATSISTTNGSDLLLCSTPLGRRGIFFKIHEILNDSYDYFKFDINSVKNELYSEKQIEKLIRDSSNPEQEFFCNFSTDENSFFGEVDDINMGTIPELEIDV